MKPIGEEATIRWYGPFVPVVGDVIRTTTGRQYLVRDITGRLKRTLRCIIVPTTLAHTRRMRWLKRRPKSLSKRLDSEAP